MLDAAFRRYGGKEGLPPHLRDAVAATPRHRFVHRFRVDDGPLHDAGTDPLPHLTTIYSDAVMQHVDAAGEKLPSSNSQPSYILYLLHMLGLQPGQTVLEIGSGSGWLAAVIARLVGSHGRVVGIELIPALAEQSRADLAAAGLANVEIITGDGAHGCPHAAPFDRAIITAATWDLPAALFNQVTEGGIVLAPIELRSGDGCEVTVMRLHSGVFVAERVVPGWFVPLLGAGQDRDVVALRERPGGAPMARFALPLGLAILDGPAPVAAQFRAFLGRTEPDFVAFAPRGPSGSRPGMPIPPFGLTRGGATALWEAGEIISYGHNEAASNLTRAYANWAALGLPGIGAFQLEIHRAEASPAGNDRMWIEHRGNTALAWRLRPEIGQWQSLLPPAPTQP